MAIVDYRCVHERPELCPEEEVDAHQLVFTRRGSFAFHGRDGATLADPTRALLLHRGEGFAVSHPAGCGDRCTVLTLDETLAREAVGRASPSAAEADPFSFGMRAVDVEPRLELLHRQLLRTTERGAEAAQVEELGFALVDGALRRGHDRTETRSRPERASTRRARLELVHAARIELGRRLGAKLRLAELGSVLHSSPFHLSRVFSEVVGRSLSAYHRDLRLRAGLERIQDGHEDLAALALELGFASHSHFTTAFRAQFGVPPSRARDPGASVDERV